MGIAEIGGVVRRGLRVGVLLGCVGLVASAALAQDQVLSLDPGATRLDLLGSSLAVSGDTMIAGAPGQNEAFVEGRTVGGNTAVVYRRRAGQWQFEARLTAGLPTSESRGFGSSVAVSGDLAAVGSPFAQPSGAVELFTRVGGLWTRQGALHSPQPALYPFTGFGSAIALLGDRLFVSAPSYLDLSLPGLSQGGRVFVYTRTASGWSSPVMIAPPTASDDVDRVVIFGGAIAVHGDTLLVGAGNTTPGDVLVYTLNGGTWTLQARLRTLLPPGFRYQFGASVAFDGRTAAVGTTGDFLENGNYPRGAVHLFTRTGATWSYNGVVTSSGPLTHTGLGASVALRDNLLLVGAPFVGVPDGLVAGRAVLFVRNSAGTWQQLGDVIGASDGRFDDHFGQAVALTDDSLIVGAPKDDIPNDPFVPFETWEYGSVRVWNRESVMTGDADSDGLPTEWELRFDLDPFSSVGANGGGGDADADGTTNLDEYLQHTHPKATTHAYLAEGATNAFFDTSLAILNPGATLARVACRFQLDGGATVTHVLTVPPQSRATLDPKSIAGLAGASFATAIDADAPVVVERTMRWDARGYGAHADMARDAPSTTWYFAEGATGDYQLFYLLQNPNATATPATVTYLLPGGAITLTRTYVLPPFSRTTIHVNQQPGLAVTDVSAAIESTAPIVAERAMYRSTPEQIFAAGHASAGVTAPATTWVLAEGATGSFFDLFILMANPDARPAPIAVDYLLPTGETLTKTYVVAPRSRHTIYVNDERFPDAIGPRLASTAVSAMVRSTAGVPVVVERTMWWPHPAWSETHNAFGATATGVDWAVAGGHVGAPDAGQTFVLIANTSLFDGQARVTLFFEDGGTSTRVIALPPSSRTSVAIASEFPGAQDRRFGVRVESVGDVPAQLVVESAEYGNSEDVVWASGTAVLATRLQ